MRLSWKSWARTSDATHAESGEAATGMATRALLEWMMSGRVGVELNRDAMLSGARIGRGGGEGAALCALVSCACLVCAVSRAQRLEWDIERDVGYARRGEKRG
jgi:hypothetical protein